MAEKIQLETQYGMTCAHNTVKFEAGEDRSVDESLYCIQSASECSKGDTFCRQ